jgi:hemerythrin superfamily protein
MKQNTGNQRGSKMKKSTSKSEKKSEIKSSMDESDSSDVITLILKEHKPIKELILVLKDPEATFEEKEPAFIDFEQLLTSHAKAEEESLYVHMKEVDDLRVEALEGDTEHALADQMIKEVNDSMGDKDTWMAKVKVLAEMVDHHVKEEEKEVFKELRKEFDLDKRVEIGEMYSRLLGEYRSTSSRPKDFAKEKNNSDLGVKHAS